MTKSALSGILSIISGSLGILGFLFIILIVIVMSFFPELDPYADPATGMDIMGVIQIVYIVSAVINLVLGILAIVGGVYSLKRKCWPLALTGAISGLLVFLPTGIPAIIFVTMGKGEFVKPSQEELLLQ